MDILGRDILVEAPGLLRRYQKGDAFRRYIDDRAVLIIPIAVLFLVFSLATTTGTVVTIGGTRSFLVLLMLVLAPFLLAGTFLVLSFVFFSWLENRSLVRMLAKVKRPSRTTPLRALLAEAPRVPWLLVALFVLLPLLLLAQLSLAAAALMLLIALAAPAAYAYLDR